MNIVYFTTSMSSKDFQEYTDRYNCFPNPSNQSFHNKLIKSLALTNHVDVISLRPFNKENLAKEIKEEGNISWHYVTSNINQIKKALTLKKEIKDLAKSLPKNSVVISDTINLFCTIFAKRFVSINKGQIIGLVTDNPFNISFTSKNYQKFLIKQSKKLDGYITLTSELNSLFNKHNKKNIILEGIIEENTQTDESPMKEEYFFFGGAMLPQYGVYNLINAYKKLGKCDKKLVICGHHYDLNLINNAIKDNPNILFLKTISVEKVHQYERHAFANINPRFINPEIDQYSIPSKTLDSLNSKRLTICVDNVKLKQYFKDDIIWAKSGDVDDLFKALEIADNISTYEYKKITQSGYDHVTALYSPNQVNKKLIEFLKI